MEAWRFPGPGSCGGVVYGQVKQRLCVWRIAISCIRFVKGTRGLRVRAPGRAAPLQHGESVRAAGQSVGAWGPVRVGKWQRRRQTVSARL
jgi:hypothetical protein